MADSALSSFNLEAFPTISMLAGVGMAGHSFYTGYIHANGQAWVPGRKIPLSFSAYLLLMGIFMIFGPGGPTGPCVNTIGILMFFLSSAGTFATLSNNSPCRYFFCGLGTFVTLAMLGAMPLFGFSTIITSMSTASCATYFAQVNLARCDDAGYLQFLRVMSMFTLFVLPAAVLNQFDAYTENAVGLGFHEAVGKSQNRVDPEDPLADRNAAAGYIAGGPYQAA